jgi:hypothetical protein
VLGAADLRQHLLGGRRHHLLDVAHRMRRETGMMTLAIVTLICGSSSRGSDEHGEHAEQERHQRQQRRDLRALEEAGDAARDAQPSRVHGATRERMRAAACGSRTTRSLAVTPASTFDLIAARAPEAHLAQQRARRLRRGRRRPVSSARRTTARAGIEKRGDAAVPPGSQARANIPGTAATPAGQIETQLERVGRGVDGREQIPAHRLPPGRQPRRALPA